MYTNNRHSYRETFYQVWQKHQQHLPLTTVEAELAAIMSIHTEYHALFNNFNSYLNQDFEPEDNPFLHMSLHIAIREQIHTDRPAGIRSIYQELLEQYKEIHDVEHMMMTCLGQIMWNSQHHGRGADEQEYLLSLKQLITPQHAAG